MAIPMAAFSPDHEAIGSLQMVTTLSAMSTLATPGRANSRSPSGEPVARSLLPKKKGPPGCKGRFTGWDAEHAGDGAKDVSIYEPDARPELLQRERQIDAHRGFSDAALAAADGDDMTDPGQLVGANCRLGWRVRCAVFIMVLVSGLHG
jgi:hypothetical protein